MKKIFCILICVMILLSLPFIAACGREPSVEDQYSEIYYTDADYWIRANTPEELPLVSDLVVLFVPSEKRDHTSYFSDGMSAGGWTVTTGTVTKVLQGEWEEGSELTLTECSHVKGDKLTTDVGYLPMQIGDEYLLFLRAYDEDSSMYGMYHITDRARGKYIPGAKNRTQYQIDSKIDLESYKQWYEAVAKMYPEVFD